MVVSVNSLTFFECFARLKCGETGGIADLLVEMRLASPAYSGSFERHLKKTTRHLMSRGTRPRRGSGLSDNDGRSRNMIHGSVHNRMVHHKWIARVDSARPVGLQAYLLPYSAELVWAGSNTG